MEGARTIESIRHFFSKVVGVTQNNADGSWRQMAVGRCQPGEPLRFVADPGNPYDENAIKVLRSSGEQLGYLNKELAEQLNAKTLEGYKYVVAVASVTETLHGGWHGCNILIIEADPDVSLAALEEFAVAHVGELVQAN
jgi:ribulose bisphosphate carboxylase small subunit